MFLFCFVFLFIRWLDEDKNILQINRHEYIVHNSLNPERYEWNYSKAIFKLNLVIDGWCISCEIALRWLTLNLTDGKSILVQVMAWCRQATSHYLGQYWPRPMSPYGVTRPQWVKWTFLSTHSGQYLLSNQHRYLHKLCEQNTGNWAVIMPTLSPRMAPQIVITTTCGAANGNEFYISVRLQKGSNKGVR